MESRNRSCLAEVNVGSTPSPRTGSTKGRSHSLTIVPPSVCITPSMEEETIATGLDSELSGSQLKLPLQNAAKGKKLPTKHGPRLSIPHIFTHSSLGSSPLTPTPSISSLLSAAAARNFSFSIPHSMRHGYWAVSLSSDRTKHPHEPLDSRPSL
ncbi:hypothetical protein DAPPUDRAFT_302237 [Daphnia pulex]|uniref:Uncharacterized protein n=1 Tax=Daphnia pulex TaxID=6669 RepID=E9HML6_DAPPU|nr:hypothetical protein DAPPUDRAFT_302237 [Daphnia pulex]|eukprot:EFX66989.1 hypothetical protein DAPPUDRAFT_302237 [Daphnia pulex]